jgi:predicted DNA-binding transcriptional regulator YafY
VARWLLRYGTDAEVVEPEALRTAVVRQATAVAAQYAGAEA